MTPNAARATPHPRELPQGPLQASPAVVASGGSLTLIIPVFNGASFLAASLEQAYAWLARQERRSEILIVDDGSTDTTASIIEDLVARVRGRPGPTITVVRNPENRGKGYSLRRAFLHANGDLIAFTDADLTYPLENIAVVVQSLEAGADVAIGNRMHPDSRYVVAPTFFGKLFRRHTAGRAFNFLVRTLAVPGVRDTQAGLKGLRRAAARALAPRQHLNRFSFDVELLFVAHRLGLRVVDCPVRFVYRKEPSTVRFVRDSLAMMRDIVRVRWNGWRGAYTREPAPAAVLALSNGGIEPRQRRITFVADDLGVSSGVNLGIARAAAAGLVREASLCVTGSAVEEGAALARRLDLGVGLHLSYSLGHALIGPIRGLTDRDGKFFDVRRVLWNCIVRRIDRTGARREAQAQVARLQQLGVRPTHLNGHHHVHCFPVLREVAFATAAEAGIRWTRLPIEHPAARWRWHPVGLLVRYLARRCEPLVAANGMRALPFIGLSLEARTDYGARFASVASRLPPGDYEWMLHPREPDVEFARLDPRGGARDPAAQAELETLANLNQIADWRRDGIVPVSFGEIAG